MQDLAYNCNLRLGVFYIPLDVIVIGDAQWPSALTLATIDTFSNAMYSDVLGIIL